MIEAVMLWNEPNNLVALGLLSRPGVADLRGDGEARRRRGAGGKPGDAPRARRDVPIDPGFIRNLQAQGALDEVDVVAVHGFPLDWNLWSVDDWPKKLACIRAATDLPVWVTEVGVSTLQRGRAAAGADADG